MESVLARLHDNVAKAIVGKDDVIDLVIAGLLARGHILIEDAPGLGKTMLARAIAQSFDATFRRIQFTPDLLPSDVTGVSIYNPVDRVFEFRHGPVFANVLLADEINRTSPRTQSSLLEAMEERQVTAEGRTYPLPVPFFVIATLNPIELMGTYPLPEAQLDRFLMRVSIGYPAVSDEEEILARHLEGEPISNVSPVIKLDDLLALQERVRGVQVSAELRAYIVAICTESRTHAGIRLGLSPRGGLAIMKAAQARAFMRGSGYVTPDDVKGVAQAVIGHRLIVDPDREGADPNPGSAVDAILRSVAVPTLPHGAPARV